MAGGTLSVSPRSYTTEDHRKALIEMSKHVSGAYGKYGVLKRENSVPYFS
jgi:hypothetical protein